MKRTIYLTAALLVFAGFTGAVVYENGSSPANNAGEGEMGITSTGSTASGTTAVGPNGTQYDVTVSMAGRSGNITEETVTEPVITGDEETGKVEFNGSITSPDLCHVIDHEIDDSDSSYTLNVITVKDELDNDTFCGQAQTIIDYEAEFEAEKPFNLTVQHDGEDMETFQVGEVDTTEPAEPPAEKKSFFDSVVSFFTGLF